MVGEIRDEDTLKTTLQAAQTGHLVLSTVHTNDALSAVTRLSQLGGDPTVFSQALIGIIAQRLVRRICEFCSEPLPAADIEKLHNIIKDHKVESPNFQKGAGCERCSFTGYKGRLGLYSYLHVIDDVAEMIALGASHEQLLAVARDNGYRTIEEAGIDHLCEGKTTIDELLPYLELDSLQRGKDGEGASSSRVFSGVNVVLGGEGSLGQKYNLRRPLDGREIVIPTKSISMAPIDGNFSDISVERTESERFTVSAVVAEKLTVESVVIPEMKKEAKGKKKAVLLVDDSESVRKMVSALLGKDFIEIIEAENGAEGFNKAVEYGPDLILCDMSMPEMTGKEFLGRIKKHKVTRDIPVIMLTIDDDIDNELDCLNNGASSLLSKRLSPVVLARRIKGVLELL
jgi:CheY-like chemotaxis protein